jgi:hypothetical protein
MEKRSAMTGAPMSWHNWAADTGEARNKLEVALYTDRRATGELPAVGPYSIHITFPPFDAKPPVLGMTLRLSFDVEQEEIPQQTSDKTYHGGDIFDEIAALLSLALGIRCKSGGIIRRWDLFDDPLGRHFEIHHRRPYLPLPDLRGPQIPLPSEEFLLTDAEPYLHAYGRLTPKAASALIRAARLYQEALWIADGEPHQAWILLVSAVEVVANVYGKAPKSPEARIQKAWPTLYAELTDLTPEKRSSLARLLAPNVRAAAKFIAFLESFMPTPPTVRPPEPLQVAWNAMPQHLQKVYEYRSRALHDGTPFPAPMCEIPERGVDVGVAPLEVPLGVASRIGSSSWLHTDTPMLLHVFDYVARSAICKWWLSQ